MQETPGNFFLFLNSSFVAMISKSRNVTLGVIVILVLVAIANALLFVFDNNTIRFQYQK
jgi:hypothetical protein